MKYNSSKLTLATIICTVVGFLLSGFLLFSNIKPTAQLPKDFILTDAKGVALDTLRFQHRPQVIYDSMAVGPGKEIAKYNVKASQFLFHFNPEFLVWLLLITGMIAIATGVLPALINRLFMLRSAFKIGVGAIVLIFLVAVVIGYLFMVTVVHNPYLYTYMDWIGQLGILFKETWILQLVIIIPTISGLIGLVGMIFISRSIEGLKPGQGNTEQFREHFHLLNRSLRFFLTVATILITFAVFTSGALRTAILQEVVVKGIDMIPLEFVYLYGLQFTIVLAIFYLPIYYQLRNKGQLFIRSLAGEPDTPDPANQNIEAFMKESAMDNIKIALSILAPLISSFLPDMINF